MREENERYLREREREKVREKGDRETYTWGKVSTTRLYLSCQKQKIVKIVAGITSRKHGIV